MSASRIAFSSAGVPPPSPRSNSAVLPSCNSAILPSCNFTSSPTMFLRVPNRVRRIGGPRALVDADRSEAPRLEYSDEFQANHFEQRQKRDDEAAAL